MYLGSSPEIEPALDKGQSLHFQEGFLVMDFGLYKGSKNTFYLSFS